MSRWQVIWAHPDGTLREIGHPHHSEDQAHAAARDFALTEDALACDFVDVYVQPITTPAPAQRGR